MPRHQRAASFAEVDHTQASGMLADILRESNVFLGGSCIGKGLNKAADYYLEQQEVMNGDVYAYDTTLNEHASSLLQHVPPEDAFYVVDLGVVVSQVYQWRRFFPRIEPFYAVKCNPDPIVLKTLAILGCNFDCASRNEIRLVQECVKHLPPSLSHKPEILFANPCKPLSHIVEAVCHHNITMMTFDNRTEVEKCARISPNIQLILRIMTDDRGSQCRLSSKFGAPRNKWRPLLQAAKQHGLQVVGVSFHVGSGCRDASRYEMALRDAREIFDLAKQEFQMHMHILDIGGGFPGETHSIWNPADTACEEDEDDNEEGKEVSSSSSSEEQQEQEHFMFFQEIAQQVAPVIDALFPPESGVRIISEPGRYFVAAAATLCCSVVSARSNEFDSSFQPEPVNDQTAAAQLSHMTHAEEERFIHNNRSMSKSFDNGEDGVLTTIREELDLYSKLYASQQLHQQEFDVYNDNLDLFKEGFESASDLLGPPEENQKNITHHTVEGMTYPLVASTTDATNQDVEEQPGGLLTLAAAGEAAVKGVVLQAVADSAPLQDDYAYYINDGVYGAFNNIMFDHAQVRPRVLRVSEELATQDNNGSKTIEERKPLFASTVFGPTCDSIDVIARSVLLPRLKVGDWMYFSNMGAYTMAASSSFNGFTPSEKVYVCSVQPEYFEALIAGPDSDIAREEKKQDEAY